VVARTGPNNRQQLVATTVMARHIPDKALHCRVVLYYKMDKASCFNRLFSVSNLFPAASNTPTRLKGSISENVRQGCSHSYRAKWLSSL
jgi:hypothetical protein